MLNKLTSLEDKIRLVIEAIEKEIAGIESNDSRRKKIINDLCFFVELISKWGSVHNVVSRNYNQYDIWENIYDSIRILPILNSLIDAVSALKNNIVDAGSGGGFPGIPLAIILREKAFFMVDSDRKKCSFLRLVKAGIELDNITVVNKKLENLEPSYLIITKAAFSPPHAGILATATKAGGKIVIWSTPNKTDEFVKVLKECGALLMSQHDYVLPSNKERRLLVFIKE